MIKPCYFVQEANNLANEIERQLELRLKEEENKEIIFDEDNPVVLCFAWGDVRVIKLYMGKDIENEENNDDVVLVETDDECGTYTHKVVDIGLSQLVEFYEIVYNL